MRRVDIVICGAGVLGLTLARELVRRGASDVLLLEKEQTLGRHASGRNSGVLHAGIYYAPGSARARTCLAGNRLMREYCLEHGLPLAQSGKVIVASTAEQVQTLRELHRRAQANGSPVRLVDERELADIEPNARSDGPALYSPETAVIDPGRILDCLAAELAASGKARILRGTAFTARPKAGVVSTTDGDLAYGFMINTAGAHGDRIARAFGLARHYRLLPFKGVYRKLRRERADMVRGSIYPVPELGNPFLGVHFTRSASGDVYLGPTAIPAFGRENYGILSGLDREAPEILLRDAWLFLRNPKFRSIALEEPRKYRFERFFNDASRLVKRLDPSDVEPSPKVGIRPQLVDLRTGELVMDFLLERGEDSLHVLNPISPAFTSSMAVASVLADEVQQMS